MPLQWRNQFWQSLEEGAGKRCPECVTHHALLCVALTHHALLYMAPTHHALLCVALTHHALLYMTLAPQLALLSLTRVQQRWLYAAQPNQIALQ